MSDWKLHRHRINTTLGGAMIAALMIYWISDLYTGNAKCQRTAATMVIEHLRTHHNTWPKHWNDLQDDYEPEFWLSQHQLSLCQ